MKTKKIFATACRAAYVSRGNDRIEIAVMDCVASCQKQLGSDIDIEGMTVTSMPDQTAVVTVLASMVRSEEDDEEG